MRDPWRTFLVGLMMIFMSPIIVPLTFIWVVGNITIKTAEKEMARLERERNQ